MKENALAASEPGKGATLVAELVGGLAANGVEVHLAAHSAGSILLAPMVGRFPSDATIKSCTLWAPAATMALYETTYHPAIVSGKIANFALYTLSDTKERDDNCAGIYHKSLLYMVSDAFEATQRVPVFHPNGGRCSGSRRASRAPRSSRRSSPGRR